MDAFSEIFIKIIYPSFQSKVPHSNNFSERDFGWMNMIIQIPYPCQGYGLISTSYICVLHAGGTGIFYL